jgi:hypothetical protein
MAGCYLVLALNSGFHLGHRGSAIEVAWTMLIRICLRRCSVRQQSLGQSRTGGEKQPISSGPPVSTQLPERWVPFGFPDLVLHSAIYCALIRTVTRSAKMARNGKAASACPWSPGIF